MKARLLNPFNGLGRLTLLPEVQWAYKKPYTTDWYVEIGWLGFVLIINK